MRTVAALWCDRRRVPTLFCGSDTSIAGDELPGRVGDDLDDHAGHGDGKELGSETALHDAAGPLREYQLAGLDLQHADSVRGTTCPLAARPVASGTGRRHAISKRPNRTVVSGKWTRNTATGASDFKSLMVRKAAHVVWLGLVGVRATTYPAFVPVSRAGPPLPLEVTLTS